MLKRRFVKLLCILAMGLTFSGCSSTAEVGPISEYQNKPVEEVESELKNQGYSNISTEEQENRSGSEYDNTVVKVTLNGVSISDSPIKAGFSEPLVIYYRGIYSGIITSPENADFYSGASLIDVKSQFIALGFKEVELEPIPNDQGSSFNQLVKTVSINGSSSFVKGEQFDVHDPVIISYYDDYSDSTEQSEGAENSSESKETSFPSKTLTFDTTDADGYKIVQTINAGYWIKASDQAALDKAWKQAGGNGNPPTVHQISRFASKADSVIAFGNISLQNSTSGFDITESNPRSVNLIGIEVEKRDADSSNQWWIQDYDGVFDLSGSLTPLGTVTNPVRVKMKSNNLGPIPFAIILPDVFTPRNGADGMKLMNYIDLAIGNHDPKEHFSLPVSW